VERLGPATIAKIKEWLGVTGATIQPVLRTDRADAVDGYEPPPWMRELVILRDPVCAFPWCTRSSRGCDLDHIDPYHEHSPPGQTRPDNLAPIADGTTAPRPAAAGDTADDPTAPTSGPHPAARPTAPPTPTDQFHPTTPPSGGAVGVPPARWPLWSRHFDHS
jgi:hypothetical protein